MQGHEIVLVTGTLEPLANTAARELEAELAARGIATKTLVRATRLEESGDRYTGRIVGEAMFGKAKSRAIRAMAQETQLDLSQCYAYGDSDKDETMLACVGNPAVVNPSRKLARIAKKNEWPTLYWKQEEDLTRRTGGSQSVRRKRNDNREMPANKPASLQAEQCA